MAGVRFVLGVHAHQPVGNFPEEQGASLALFPISQRFRCLIPFREPAETLDYLRQRAALAPGGIAVMADDAEKFGGWPGTHWLGLAVRIDLAPAARLWRFPVQTISQSESGYERVPQQICLLPAWPLGGPMEGTELRLTLAVETREAAPA